MSRRLRGLWRTLLIASIFSGIFSMGVFTSHFVSAAGQDQVSTHANQGRSLVLVGGALSNHNDTIYSKIVDLAGGKGVARIGIITAASPPLSQDKHAGGPGYDNSEENAKFYANLFKKHYGVADAEWIPIDLDHLKNNASPKIIAQINSMTGFFFGGGDQSRLIYCFFYTDPAKKQQIASPAAQAIMQKYDDGTVVSGTSAGTDAQVKAPMITNGESYEGLLFGAFPYIRPHRSNRLEYNPFGGFGTFSYGLLDTHFTERGREGRLIRLAADTQTPMAYGIDQNTALVVTNADTPNAQMQVIGAGGAYILDLSQASVGQQGKYWTISNVKVTYLTVGDMFNPTTKQVTIASWKTPLAGHEKYAHAWGPTHDIFSSFRDLSNGGRGIPRAFTKFSTNLFNSRSTSTYGLTYETQPVTFEVLMTKVQGSAGYIGVLQGVQYISYVDLKVDIFPVPK